MVEQSKTPLGARELSARWYMLNTNIGSEYDVANALKERSRSAAADATLENDLQSVMVVSDSEGNVQTPGWIYIKAILTAELKAALAKIVGTGPLAGISTITPMTDEEYSTFKEQAEKLGYQFEIIL